MLLALCRSLSGTLGRGLCLVGLSLLGSAHAASVAFLNPGHPEEVFWRSYSRFMQCAADDLGLQLQVHYIGRDASSALSTARVLLLGPRRPDYLVLVNEQYVAPAIMRLAHGTGVKLVLVSNGLTQSQARAVDAQPETFAPLLATLTGNDEQAGYLMLHAMLDKLPRLEGPIDLLAFAGIKTTPASQLREQGMRRALADFPQVRLRQVVYGGWDRQRAYEQAQILLQRYPDTRLVWSANDEMAFGAMRAFAQAGRIPGHDVIFSAVNSSPEALRARIDGRLSVLMGGQFMLGGWAMVMLHDDALGLPIDRDGQRDYQLPVLRLIDQDRARRWLALPERGAAAIDFRRYSAEGRPPGYRYPFLTQPIVD